MNTASISFQSIDSWFFRESRPMEASGELQSNFPPGIRTLSGAIRSWIGEQEKVNWKEFNADKNHPLHKIIGSNIDADLGQLHFNGVFVSKAGKRLYPAPLHLLKKETKLYPLQISEAGISCDLGKNIRLAELPCDDAKGSKPLEQVWVDQDKLLEILQGDIPDYSKAHFFTLDELVEKESRVGIARNNNKRTVITSLLYQVQHLRPCEDVKLEVDITGLPDSCAAAHLQQHLIRLGGEARMASLQVKPQRATLPAVKPVAGIQYKGILIYLMTPLFLERQTGFLPEFKYVEDTNPAYWAGTIENIELKLHSAVTGKATREGGWDIKEREPRTDKSLIPAGSIFFCDMQEQENITNAINAMHGKQIGELQNLGYGQIAIGLWM